MTKLENMANKYRMIGIDFKIYYGCIIRKTSKYDVDVYISDQVKTIGPGLKRLLKGDVYLHGDAKLERIDLSLLSEVRSLTIDLDTSRCTSGLEMFKTCTKLEEIKFIRFDTSKFETMRCMFSDCFKLKRVNFDTFDTSNCTNFKCMFEGCSDLEELDLSSFDTRKVAGTADMFSACTSLKHINLSSFRLPELENMNSMFIDCSSLNELDLSSFGTTNKLIHLEQAFYNCSSLTRVDISNLNTESITSFAMLFSGCIKLEQIIGIEDICVINASTCEYMFSSCNNLRELNLSEWIVGPDCIFKGMFARCINLQNIDLTNFIITDPFQVTYMFKMCRKLREIHITSFIEKTTKADSLVVASAFDGCISLLSVIIHGVEKSEFDKYEQVILNGIMSLRNQDVSIPQVILDENIG